MAFSSFTLVALGPFLDLLIKVVAPLPQRNGSVSPLFQITVRLDLRDNNLQLLPRGAFLRTPYLTHLNLQRCNILEVKEGAFRTLGRVVSLNLANNKIELLYQVR